MKTERELSAGAILLRRDKPVKFLLLHYEEGHWDFPKGHVEEGESQPETVKREVEEETGITNIKLVDGFKERINYYFKIKERTIFKEVDYFLAETKEKNVRLSNEHIGYRWVSYESALKLITYENSKGVLEKAKKFVDSINVK